ncbi:hypothetical protein JW962_01545 [Candidatus Dojkabacteria bacterium]|nr:hypothetical protein [Candidatus Dojkabacteria bacterium]
MKFLILAKRKFYSVRQLMAELSKRKISVDFYTYKDITISVNSGKLSILVGDKNIKHYTHILPRKHSNKIELNIRYILAKYCNKHGIRMLNKDVLLAMPHYTKLYQMYLLSENGIPYLDTLYLSSGQYNKIPKLPYTYPVVLKKIEGHAGNEVWLIHNEKELKTFLYNLKYKRECILQRFAPVNEDVRLMIVGQRVIGAWHRKSLDEFKTTAGEREYKNYDNPPIELKTLGNKVGKLLAVDYGAFDVMYYKGKPHILETNLDASFKAYETKVGTQNDMAKLIIDQMLKSR